MPPKYQFTLSDELLTQPKTLSIFIETPRLVLRSLLPEDDKACASLTSDPIVMEKFMAGTIWSAETYQTFLQIWLTRWEKLNPYSAYVIVDKKQLAVIGIALIDPVEKGVGEIGYLLDSTYWGKGYGREAIEAIFQSLIPNLMLHHYQLDHAPLKKLVATARIDNVASQKLLEGVRFQETGITFKFGAWRYQYALSANQLLHEYHRSSSFRDRKRHKSSQAKGNYGDFDVTDLEMAMSVFGQRHSQHIGLFSRHKRKLIPQINDQERSDNITTVAVSQYSIGKK
jgi:ribosomal-protein-alanine N-acetyltransferase